MIPMIVKTRMVVSLLLIANESDNMPNKAVNIPPTRARTKGILLRAIETSDLLV